MFVKTLNITDSISNIETNTTYKYYWVRNLGAEDVSVFKASADADTNKKIILSQDEYVKIMPTNNNIYFKSSSTGTKIEVYGTNTDICPFKTGNVKENGGDGGGGRTETILWQYDPNTMRPSQNITLSDKLSNYDEVCFIPYYVPDGATTRTGNSYYFGSQFTGASDSDRKYVSVTGVTAGAAEYCDFKYDGNVTLYFCSLSKNNALWVYSIIGIKY